MSGALRPQHKVLAVVPHHCPLRHQYQHEEGYLVYGLRSVACKKSGYILTIFFRMMGLHHAWSSRPMPTPYLTSATPRQVPRPSPFRSVSPTSMTHMSSTSPAPPLPSADLNDNYIEKIAKHVYGFMEKRSPVTPKWQLKKDVLWEQVQADLERNQNMVSGLNIF